MDAIQLLDEIFEALVQMDECFANNDTNNALKKTHECMAKIKSYKESINEQCNNDQCSE